MRQRSGLVLASLMLACGGIDSVSAADNKYDNYLAELRQMVESRNLDKFEFDFVPMKMDRLVIPERSGGAHTFHYITFRLRNKVSANAEYVMEHRTAFNEVMEQITKQFESATYQTDGGPRLFTDAPTIEDPDLATIVESEDLKVAKRHARITVQAYDENGSTFRLFEEDPLNTPIDLFDFEDFGDIREGNVYLRVKEKIEEREGRRLLSVHEIRQKELAPFDASRLNDEGVAQGEVYGVLIFDRLPTEGDFFTVRIQGLSNKMRVGKPDHRAEQLADYINTRYKRRTYVLEVERKGDEYFLDQDAFSIKEHGWEWVPAFERIRHRSTMAYSQYFLENHPLAAEESETVDGKPSPVLKNNEVDQAFWQYMQASREEIAAVFDDQISQVERDMARVEKRYTELLDGDRLNEDEVLRRQQGWKEAFTARKQALQQEKAEALRVLDQENFEAQTKNRE